jgi:hypothetical protein
MNGSRISAPVIAEQEAIRPCDSSAPDSSAALSRRCIAVRGEPQDLGGNALFQFGHRADLVPTEFAANEGVILGPFAKVETVLAAPGTFQLNTHDAIRSERRVDLSLSTLRTKELLAGSLVAGMGRKQT